MTSRWTEQQSRDLWQKRIVHLLTRDHHDPQKVEELRRIEIARKARDDQQRTSFQEQFAEKLENPTNAPRFAGSRIAANLEFWMTHASWSYCDDCKLIHTEKLGPTYPRRPKVKLSKQCQCKLNRYHTPRAEQIPAVLHNLSIAEIRALRPFIVHCGDYQRAQHGYVKKTSMFRLEWSALMVEDKIAQIPDEVSRRKCRTAYQFLMSHEQSAYAEFIQKHREAVATNQRFNVYRRSDAVGVECALWPHLYPYKAWCETILDGTASRPSTKLAFMTKVFSEVVDYALSYELLHFHFDLWLFKTVSGAISTARRLRCSPAKSLDCKTFSVEYWKWEHRCLLDAVRQFGFPSVFVTVSPYEWTFPLPPWLLQIRNTTGYGPTALASFETAHITHVLEQIIRGCLCGSNSNRWINHVFANERAPGTPNIETYFYRFEFQERGTAHIHLLVWLKNLPSINTEMIRADIPWRDGGMAYEVYKLQKANESPQKLNEHPTSTTQSGDTAILQLYHPAEAFACHLRAYITTLTASLKCRMDFQTTDGRDMLLRYVTSYVSKWHDAYSNDALYSVHTTPYEAAYRHLREMKMLEPEMWMALSSKKTTWTPSRRKKFTVPTRENIASNICHGKYRHRSEQESDLSFLEWLRSYDETKANPTSYKDGTTLVGLKMRSPLKDEFFFQHLLLNIPHRSIAAFMHPRVQDVPQHLKFFASAIVMQPQIWQDDHEVNRIFSRGHREYFIRSITEHVASLRDAYFLWQRSVVLQTSFEPEPATPLAQPDAQQSLVLREIQHMFELRRFYDGIDCLMSEEQEACETGDEDDINRGFHAQHRHNEDGQVLAQNRQATQDWHKFVLVTGKPGTGKSHVLKVLIANCVEEQRSVLVATPTGFLANEYRTAFPGQITADTIHGAFQYPVLVSDSPSIKWNLASYDLIIIDELSMVPTRIFRHIVVTITNIPVRPIVVLSGDQFQQQPIETIGHMTTATQSAMQDPSFRPLFQRYRLTIQHRSENYDFTSFLDHIRHWRPSTAFLDRLQDGRVLCNSCNPTDQQLLSALTMHQEATVLTVSRHASRRINDVAINHIFRNQLPLATVHCDNGHNNVPIYAGLKVMLTQNRDKDRGIVNGQFASVHLVQNKTIFLRLPNQKIVETYPVTSQKPNGTLQTAYPFVPCYSMTICKSQGQTLDRVIIWFDVPTVPPGAGYVAISRVRRLDDIFFLTPLESAHFTPVAVQ